MPLKLTHPFVNKIPNPDEIFLDKDGKVITSINTFCARVLKLAEKYDGHIKANDFKGNALEMFVEFMIKTNESDNRIGIYDYKVVPSVEDYGVDGVGRGENGNPAAVQVKFRQADYVLAGNEDHLTNFLNQSVFGFGVKMEDTKNLLIVTTGLKVAPSTLENMLYNRVRVLNRAALSTMFDGRLEWWTRLYESIIESRVKTAGKRQPLPLRQHQEEAVDSVGKSEIGKVILPTGAGKTLVEVDTIKNEILRLQSEGVNAPLIVVRGSRILLCFQLFEEIFNRLVDFGIEAKYVNFNSGRSDDDAMAKVLHEEGMVYRQLESTTSPNNLKNHLADCHREGIPLIIISTYHSAGKLESLGEIPHLVINDEAHNLVSRDFSGVAKMEAKKQYFFTATEKITDCDSDRGMNNSSVFGDYLYTKSAADLISAGEMVAPWVHVVRSTNNSLHLDKDYRKMFESVLEAFDRHQGKIRGVSFAPEKMGAKVLVVCRGQEDLMGMLTPSLISKMKESHPDVRIYGLSSEFGVCNDGEITPAPVTNKKKYDLLKSIKALKSDEKCLIFHVDMIGEGIDVSGITGVMPFRNCQTSSLIQNIGRSTRLHPEDRKAFYRGDVSVDERLTGGWIKPNSWVIIPSFMVDSEGMESRFREITKQLRNEFGFIPQEQVVIDNNEGIPEEEEIDVVNSLTNKPHGKSEDFDGSYHEFEKVSAIARFLIEEATFERRDSIVDLIFGHLKGVKKEKVEVNPKNTPAKKRACKIEKSHIMYVNETTGEKWVPKGRGRPPKWVSLMKKGEVK